MNRGSQSLLVRGDVERRAATGTGPGSDLSSSELSEGEGLSSKLMKSADPAKWEGQGTREYQTGGRRDVEGESIRTGDPVERKSSLGKQSLSSYLMEDIPGQTSQPLL